MGGCSPAAPALVRPSSSKKNHCFDHLFFSISHPSFLFLPLVQQISCTIPNTLCQPLDIYFSNLSVNYSIHPYKYLPIIFQISLATISNTLTLGPCYSSPSNTNSFCLEFLHTFINPFECSLLKYKHTECFFVSETGENSIMRGFMICITQQILVLFG